MASGRTIGEQPARVRAGYRGASPRASRAGGRAAAFVLVRVTGLLLTVLALGHFALTHVVTDVAETDSAFVARRWGTALWVVWDAALLAAALLHGAAGVALAIDDYVPAGPRRARWRRALVAVSVAAFLLGTATLLAAVLG